MRHQFLTQIKHDCKFLEQLGFMDYSLLLGVHVLSAKHRQALTKGSVENRILANKISLPRNFLQKQLERDRASSVINENLPTRMPARVVRIARSESEGSTTSSQGKARTDEGSIASSSLSRRKSQTDEGHEVLLFVGIIDFLQGYNMVKRVEHVYKSLQFDPQSISAVNPHFYSTRFQEFIAKVFTVRDVNA
ncbi:Phosphatidylinositol 4-phosphate 5-kinase 5 [Acorus calamus]|uniref:1-phosphatidylinositol-4-phosphate 5-kinase n=1 Tax=Acorus calamus TaxID=4465 RepID=A0AAV9C8F4_ACOCL|nr:Phosphatidylinositol 4-phosphate 5-kinase 5 [Acorus calamus]